MFVWYCLSLLYIFIMKPTALLITQGQLTDNSAKTAHGLIRSSGRFEIAGVIDGERYAGKNARALIGERTGYVPIYANLEQALENSDQKIDYAIVGLAPKGGRLPSEIKVVLRECLQQGISLISGLHEFIGDAPDLVSLARENGQTITDIRRPVERKDLHFWDGSIFRVRATVVAVLGPDTNMGKRTTANMLRETCNSHGIRAEMVFTGQTGWLQDGRYGFVLDTTPNDFVSGELAYWVCKCDEETHPDIIFLEGQSGLRNPSGPCGSELLLSAGAKHVVLLFSPARRYFGDNNPTWGELPAVESEIALIRLYGSEVIALALHTKGCSETEIGDYRREYTERTGLPVLLPLKNGVEEFLPVISSLIRTRRQELAGRQTT
jgi:uncharacterized NAD-dependent epimerase/dehydratase family protein